MSFLFINVVDCIAFALFLYLFIAFRDHRRRRGHPYPPGPPSHPILGNLLDVPKRAPWVTYADMSKKYGDVFCIHIFGQVLVVLCSLPAIKDLLEKRGEAYADRPTLPIMEITDTGWPLFNARKGEVWREGRKLLDRSLRPGATMSYRQIMQENTHVFLARLLATPKEFRRHIKLLQGGLIVSLTYGYDPKEGDYMMTIPVEVSETMTPLVAPGGALVNGLPFLKYIPSWVPWLSYKPLAQRIKRLSEIIRNDPINSVKNAMHEGTAKKSLATEHLQEIEGLVGPEYQIREDIVKITLGSLFLAGVDTTVSAITSLFLALALYPQVQKRAQEELDLIVGRDRLPRFDDRPRLPYIEAIYRELLRWQVPTPMGLPHMSCEDDAYKGFFIPKGSIIVANAWAILHDPEIFPDPEEFKPDRFLEEDGSFRDDPTMTLAFGVGKRICPGRHFADSTLFIVASSVLSVFNVTKAKDDNGHEIPVKAAMTHTSNVIVQLEEFECSISVRDKAAEELISVNSLL